MRQWLDCVAAWLMFVPGPLMPYVLAWLFSGPKRTWPRVLAFGSLLALLLFATFLIGPYYACGFGRRPFYQAGERCWIITLPFIQAFAYFYSFPDFGFIWLTAAIISAAFGTFSSRPLVNTVLKILVLVSASAFLTLLNALDYTINSFLE